MISVPHMKEEEEGLHKVEEEAELNRTVEEVEGLHRTVEEAEGLHKTALAILGEEGEEWRIRHHLRTHN